MRLQKNAAPVSKSGREPLEVDGRRREEGLDAHVVEAATDGPRKAVPGLGLAMDAFHSPAVALVKARLPLSPPKPLAPRAQKRGVIYIEDHDPGVARRADAARPERTAAAIPRSGVEMLEGAALKLALGVQDLTARASREVVAGRRT